MNAPHWKCTICGLVADGPEPPSHCPECEARREMFVATTEPAHGIAHNPIQPRDNHPVEDFAPGACMIDE